MVLIHTTSRSLELSHFDLRGHELTLFLNQASRFAVPLFFLISGFALTISNSQTGYKEFLKKRFSKVLVPYLFWSLFYYFLVYKDSDNLLKALLTGSASYQLYFIPSILIFYLIFPFLKKLTYLFKNKLIIIFLFIIQILILNFDYQYHAPLFPYPISVAMFNFFPFLIGIHMAKNQEFLKTLTKKFWPVFTILTLVLAVFIFNEGLSKYYQTWNYIYFYSQWRPSVLIYTILVFLVLYLPVNKLPKAYLNLIKTLSSLSFFVFFIHIVILESIYKYLYKSDIIFFSAVSGISASIPI